MTSLQNKKAGLLLLCFFLAFFAWSQEPVEVERSSNKVILEGKIYYIHIVKPGQTLYAISRAYGVGQKEISIENPGAMSGIQVGQALKIPVVSARAGQIDTSEKESDPLKGGRTHKVKRGETFFRIAKSYGLSEKELLDANPNIKPEELRPGQRLLIPEPESFAEIEEEPAYNEEGFAYHRVKKKETLYSIARFYDVGVHDIRVANPELGWGGPKAGQVIRVPLPLLLDQPALKDTIPVDTLRTEFDSIGKEWDYEEIAFEPADPFRTYRIAYFIPFAFEKPEPLDSLLKDVESRSRRNRITERYRMEQRIPQSVHFLEFFQGSLMAIDELQENGMLLEVNFYDTQRSMDRTLEILGSEDIEEMDLIIGPFYDFNLELVAAFAMDHRIPVVTPFYDQLDLIWNNPYLFQLSPSLETSHREMAKLVASKHDYNIVIVREEDSLDVEKNLYLQNQILDGFDDYRPAEPVIFKELVLTLDHTDEIIHSLRSDRKNLVLVPSSNEALASRVVSSLYYTLKDFEIEIIGTAFWPEFSSIDYRYYHELGLMIGNPFWLNYLDPEVSDFLASYREYFYNEPRAMSRKGINYGVAGYDITLYFGNALRAFGKRFMLSLDEYQTDQVLYPYTFSRVSRTGGFENCSLPYYRFVPDMSIQRIEVPPLPERYRYFFPWQRDERIYLNRDMDH